MERHSRALGWLVALLLNAGDAHANFFGDPGEYMVQGNPEAAARSLEQRAAQGEADAMFALAHLYRIGAGVPRDVERSTALYRQAAELGHVEAQYMIGICYARGRGVAKDPEQARRWLSTASRSGHADATLRLRQLESPQPTAPSSSLVDRVSDGDVGAVRAALDAGANPNSRDALGTPVLHTAVLRGQRAIVSELVDRGADLDATDAARDTVLHVAAANNDVELVNMLIARGADANVVNAAGWTPRQLLARHTSDATVAHTQTSAVQRLDAYAGDARYADWSELAVAASLGDTEVVTALLAQGRSPGADRTGYTPLARAVQAGQVDAARLLLDAGGDPAFHSPIPLVNLAVINGDGATLNLLLTHDVPLDAADANGDAALALAVRDAKADLVEQLLSHGAPVDRSDARGLTALMLASDAGAAGLTTTLLRAGADSRRTDANGRNALHHAASSCVPEVIQALAPRSPRAPDALGRWPLHMAATTGCTALAGAVLAQGHPVDPVSSADNTPLAIAAASGSSEIVEILLAHDANPNRRDRRGETPLHRAVRKGHLQTVAILLAGGANPSIRNANGLNAFDLSTNSDLIALLNSDEPLQRVAVERH